MVPHSMTLLGSWLGFQGRNIFRHWICQKRREIDADGQSYYSTIFGDLDWPQTLARLFSDSWVACLSSNNSDRSDDDHHAVLRLLNADDSELMLFGVNQSPVTEADVDFLYELTTFSTTNVLLTSLRLDQSSYWFTATLSVLWCIVFDQNFWVDGIKWSNF